MSRGGARQRLLLLNIEFPHRWESGTLFAEEEYAENVGYIARKTNLSWLNHARFFLRRRQEMRQNLGTRQSLSAGENYVINIHLRETVSAFGWVVRPKKRRDVQDSFKSLFWWGNLKLKCKRKDVMMWIEWVWKQDNYERFSNGNNVGFVAVCEKTEISCIVVIAWLRIKLVSAALATELNRFGGKSLQDRQNNH